MAINSVQILGNCGRDPDIRTMNSGDRVATLSVATTDKWTDKQTGEIKEATEWHRVVVFGKGLIDKVIEPYVHKGSQVVRRRQAENPRMDGQRRHHAPDDGNRRPVRRPVRIVRPAVERRAAARQRGRIWRGPCRPIGVRTAQTARRRSRRRYPVLMFNGKEPL